MKVAIVETGDFAYLADLSPLWCREVGGWCLTVSSLWRSARDPREEQTRLQIVLDDEGLRALARLVEQAIHESATPSGERDMSMNPRQGVAIAWHFRARKAYRESLGEEAPVWVNRFGRGPDNQLLEAAARLRWRLPADWLLAESEQGPT